MTVQQVVVIHCGPRGADFYLEAESTRSHFRQGAASPGCMQNELFRGGDGECIWIQKWKDDAALVAHMISPHTSQHIAFCQAHGLTFEVYSGKPRLSNAG